MNKRIDELTINGEGLSKIIKKIKIHSEYQPILETADLTIFGYEALARFEIDGKSYSPDKIFSIFEKDYNKLHELEVKIKENQIDHRPPNKTLFLNIDPKMFHHPKIMSFWQNFFIGKENIVIEIIESGSLEAIERSKTFIEGMGKIGISCALDDLFSENTMFSPAIFIATDIVKIDMKMLTKATTQEEYSNFLKEVVTFCKANNKKVVIEGVETKRHLEVARICNGCFVQGHHFMEMYELSPRKKKIIKP